MRWIKLPMLNAEQRTAFDTVMGSMDAQDGSVFGLNAGRGTGKTHTLNLYVVQAQGMGPPPLPASQPLSSTADSLCLKPKPIKEVCKETRLIIIDEVTIGHCQMFDVSGLEAQGHYEDCGVQARAKDVWRDILTVLFTGDWWQILPVVPKGHTAQILQACFLKSYTWAHVHVLTLVTEMLAALVGGGKEEFATFLHKISTRDAHI
ncbi:uncharacterized protein LOC131890684 [Tigriopus californicus]|uniref:uncharacterized protein LOC131890684 n=1 Tax=Tigriopus californicus TaxID=6832 RepID=UPI0027DA4908|nr:uncharacterized protein LOC131890684 [Tigriopus californicus]